MLGENVAQSIARGAVNDSMGDNIDFQEDAGLQTLIVRTDGGGCCDWCASVCGEFHSREELPEDFWRVHRNCSCVIDYRVGKTNAKIQYITNQQGLSKNTTNNINITVTNNSNSGKIDFIKANTIEEAKQYAKDVLGFTTIDYDKFNLDVANMVNEEVTKLYNTFGNLHDAGVLDGIRFYPKKVDWYAGYSPGFKEVFMRNVGSKNAISNMEKAAIANYNFGFWSTPTPQHAINHEVGHAIQYYLAEGDALKLAEITKLREDIMTDIGITSWDMYDSKEHKLAAGGYLSYYGLKSNGEFIAESIAEYQTGNARETAQKVVDILLKK